MYLFLSLVRCVRDNVVQRSGVDECVWTQTVGASTNVTKVWSVDNGANTFIVSKALDYPSDADAWHIGRGSGSTTQGNPHLAIWFIQLLVSFDSVGDGLAEFRPCVFRPELIHALFTFIKISDKTQKVRALRTLAAVLRRTPASALTPPVMKELAKMRETVNRLYSRQKMIGFYSMYFQSLVEVMVSIGLKQSETMRHSGSVEKYCDAALREVVCKEPWFKQLLEVANIAEALVDRKTKNLPQGLFKHWKKPSFPSLRCSSLMASLFSSLIFSSFLISYI